MSSQQTVTQKIERKPRYYLSIGYEDITARIPVYSGRQINELLAAEDIKISKYRLRKAIHVVKNGCEGAPLGDKAYLFRNQKRFNVDSPQV